jgi:hypothetical protein
VCQCDRPFVQSQVHLVTHTGHQVHINLVGKRKAHAAGAAQVSHCVSVKGPLTNSRYTSSPTLDTKSTSNW